MERFQKLLIPISQPLKELILKRDDPKMNQCQKCKFQNELIPKRVNTKMRHSRN